MDVVHHFFIISNPCDLNITNGMSKEKAETIWSDTWSDSVTPTAPDLCLDLLQAKYWLKYNRNCPTLLVNSLDR